MGRDQLLFVIIIIMPAPLLLHLSPPAATTTYHRVHDRVERRQKLLVAPRPGVEEGELLFLCIIIICVIESIE